ncbi:MAG: hypothetical protein J07HN4v3_01949 [Halonotius sp. J07HN4]|nr:MAG: hypothetical protein J07HN4v3_01949 [Halonotius sp. J07HN4]
MLVAFVVGLEPADVKSPHTERYCVGIYKHGESVSNPKTVVIVPLAARLPILTIFHEGRKYISCHAVCFVSESVL